MELHIGSEGGKEEEEFSVDGSRQIMTTGTGNCGALLVLMCVVTLLLIVPNLLRSTPE